MIISVITKTQKTYKYRDNKPTDSLSNVARWVYRDLDALVLRIHEEDVRATATNIIEAKDELMEVLTALQFIHKEVHG